MRSFATSIHGCAVLESQLDQFDAASSVLKKTPLRNVFEQRVLPFVHIQLQVSSQFFVFLVSHVQSIPDIVNVTVRTVLTFFSMQFVSCFERRLKASQWTTSFRRFPPSTIFPEDVTKRWGSMNKANKNKTFYLISDFEVSFMIKHMGKQYVLNIRKKRQRLCQIMRSRKLCKKNRTKKKKSHNGKNAEHI